MMNEENIHVETNCEEESQYSSKEEEEENEDSVEEQPEETEEIKQLRKEIDEAIKNRDYKQAEMLNKKLENKYKSKYNNGIDKAKEFVQTEVEKAIQEYRTNLKTINKSKENRQLPVYLATDEVYLAMKEQHIQKLTDLKAQCELELFHAESLKSSEEIRLDTASEVLAKGRKFQEAERMYKLSQEEHNRFVKDTKANIQRSYIERERKLFDQFRQELNVLKEKCLGRINGVGDGVSADQESVQKRLRVRVLNIIKNTASQFADPQVAPGSKTAKLKGKSTDIHAKAVGVLSEVAWKILLDNQLNNIVNLRKVRHHM